MEVARVLEASQPPTAGIERSAPGRSSAEVFVSDGDRVGSICSTGPQMTEVLEQVKRPAEADVVRQFLVELGLENHWSEGSKLHLRHKCKPCHYWHTLGGCVNGSACRFCHLAHTKTSDAKTKRDLCRRFADAIDDPYLEKATEILATRSKFLQRLLERRMRTWSSMATHSLDTSRVGSQMGPWKKLMTL